MNDDLISRKAAISELMEWVKKEENKSWSIFKGSFHWTGIKAMLECLPPAHPETAKRIVGKSIDGMTLWYQCDMCNEPVDAQDNFCRGCGRRLTDG